MSRVLSYYGDDFTGSTDVMEALATHGIETVLFTRLPTEGEFEPFASHRAIGLAGTSRSQPPAWMDQNLPAIFDWLKRLNARFCHYKVCSTFDSAPHVGSIGRAIDIAAGCFNQKLVPLVVGAPQLKRYTFAGHLFAAYQGQIYRIDRHPVMGRHPVTPMHESDLRLHLSHQTGRTVTLVGPDWPGEGIALLDVFDEATQVQVGEQLLSLPAGATPFIAGSSGVEYALMKALLARGEITGKAHFKPLQPVSQVIVVSGSVSPTTERQIRTAIENGFVSIPVDAVTLATVDREAIEQAIAQALRVLDAGKSPLVHTALGPASDEGERLNGITGSRDRIGAALGEILRRVTEASQLSRVIVAGGDSSSHALGQLDIFALTCRLPLAQSPGSPLCLAHSGAAKLNGLEIALKGGQLGDDRYFVRLRDGQ